MLGWSIWVYRMKGPEALLALPDVPSFRAARRRLSMKFEVGDRLAVWQTGLGGTGWVDELVKSGDAVRVVDKGGYPCTYLLQAKSLLPIIADGPPGARERWLLDAHDIVLPEWEGKTVIDRAAVASLAPGEWIFVEAWDES